MLHCVRKQLKTADEKLRNIGKPQSQSGTVVQTHNFTYYKNQQPSPSPSPSPQQPQRPSQPDQKQQQEQQRQRNLQQQRQLQQQIRKTEESDPGMASRAVNRSGRRDRNGATRDDLERAEIKRRSRSEGPNRRVRQSMDEREGGKKQIYDGGGRGRYELDSPDSDNSDHGRGSNVRAGGRVESESDSDDPKMWTKNPLLVRKVRKSDKSRLTEKRHSGGAENGRSRDSWGSYGNEDGSSGGGGTGSGGRSKYQKLEERRKKRINLAVTSDEENATPASRISRLRQRAIQSGLGEQTNVVTSSQVSHGPQPAWGNSPRQSQIQYQPSQQQFMPQKPTASSSTGIYDNFSRLSNVVTPGTPSRADVTRSQYIPGSAGSQYNPSNQPTYPPGARRSAQPIMRNEPSVSYGEPPKIQTPKSQRVPPARPPPPRLTPQHTTPELVSRRVFNTSSNANAASPEPARISSQIHFPSSTPVHVNAPANQVISSPIKPRFQISTSQSPSLSQQQRGGANLMPSQITSISPSRSPTQFNEVVEMRLRTNRPSSLQKLPKRDTGHISEDSLDELIESNIQYLDSEIEKSSKKKTPSASVSRSSSLPDPRRFSGHGSEKFEQQPQPLGTTIQAQPNSRIQLQVPLSKDNSRGYLNSEPPLIRIAPSNLSVPSNTVQSSPYPSQSELVPRKLSYDSRSSRGSRPSSEYLDRDDLSKSDSQLNAPVVLAEPGYFGPNLHPNAAYARGCVSDVNLTSTNMASSGGLQVPQMDKGMFSDVEYDIEVSERVKKWEKFMKVQDTPGTSGSGSEGGVKKSVNLSTIQEKQEGEPLMLPSEVRKSVLMRKNNFPLENSGALVVQQPGTVKHFSSDTSINRDPETPRVFALETNARRFFQVIQDPTTGPRLGFQSQSVSSVFHAPMEIKTSEPGYLNANDLRQQMLSNRQGPSVAITSGFAQAHIPLGPQDGKENQPEQLQAVVRRTPSTVGMRDAAKRGSKYQEELDEISAAKVDTVVSLRRRFDTDSNASDDDQKSVSRASAKLSRPTGIVGKSGDTSGLDWSAIVPDYESKVKDSEVWSPSLESTQGVPVSIERVTARTLQTIPFSEDPFWKEIEEMTSFDPNSMAGHLSFTAAATTTANQDTGSGFDSLRSQQQIELKTPQSSTLPSHPRPSAVTPRERMQRSKSLYTPNITPLTISVDKPATNATTALDEVLYDIRSSMEKKPQSPMKISIDKTTEAKASAAAGVFAATPYKRPESDLRVEGNQLVFKMPTSAAGLPQSVRKFETSSLAQMRADQPALPSKQPLQFYQQQRLQQQQQHQPSQTQQPQPIQMNRQSQLMQSNVSGYQLDPDLLKQKLLSTGLVVETDTEDTISSAPFLSDKYSPQTSLSNRPLSQLNIGSSISSNVKNTMPLSNSNSHPTSSMSSTVSVTQSRPFFNPARPGTSALDDIQQALAPFSSSTSYDTLYEPTPESLYGTARLEEFSRSGADTTRGSNTKPTSWTFQPIQKLELERANRAPETRSQPSESRLQRVNESMDDLKDLAQNVERRINVIKAKLQTADDSSLDSVLKSLKRLAPGNSSQDEDAESVEDYYTTKKSKLSDALTELDRIYKDLELNTDDITGIPQKRTYKQYRPTKSSDFILAPQPKSDALRPMQTRISSVYIPGLDNKSKSELEKETESEFDVITKSFQAIVDEVNKTTDMLAQKSQTENTAPEAQKHTFKVTMKPGESSMSQSSSGSLSTGITSSIPTLTSISTKPNKPSDPPATAPKPQDAKTRGGRFRAKLHAEVTNKGDDSEVKKERSKSVPDLESNAADLMASIEDQSPTKANTNFNATAIPYQKDTSSSSPVAPTTTTVTSTPPSATVSTPPPAARQRNRVRPVKDNKIIQNDKANRKEGVPLSPQPSPKFTRKIIYNSGLADEVNIRPPPKMFQDEESTDQAPNSETDKQSSNVTSGIQFTTVKAKIAGVSPVSSPVLQRKMPPPTAAKPSLIPSSVPATPQKQDSTPSKGIPKPTPQLGSKPAPPQVSLKSVPAPATGVSKEGSKASPRLIMSTKKTDKGKLDKPELQTEATVASPNIGGARGRRKLGVGVALMMDKFKGGEGSEALKTSTKRLGTLSAPDLSTDVKIEDEDDVKDDENSSNVRKPSDSDTPKSTVTKIGSICIPAPTQEQKSSDPEGKLPNSGTASPQQPSSPSNKPPLHPLIRQTSDLSDRQITVSSTKLDSVANKCDNPNESGTDDTAPQPTTGSPKVVSKLTKMIVGTKPTEGKTKPSESGGSSSESGSSMKISVLASPKSPVRRRVRPPDRKIQTGASAADVARSRPHSFHELPSSGRPRIISDAHRVSPVNQTRPTQASSITTSAFGCRSEPDLNFIETGPAKGFLAEKVFIFDIKPKGLQSAK